MKAFSALLAPASFVLFSSMNLAYAEADSTNNLFFTPPSAEVLSSYPSPSPQGNSAVQPNTINASAPPALQPQAIRPRSNLERCKALLTEAPDYIDIKVAMMPADNHVSSAYCLVSGIASQHIGAESQFYSIKFELRLPDFWQGRFAQQFNDSIDGSVQPALGRTTGMLFSQYAINQGFAVLSSNEGHFAKANTQKGHSAGVTFGHDPETRRDYGYAAIQKLNPIARELVESYYEKPIQYSYGIGQSNGGRVAMVVASRFPTMFDGLLAGSPGFNAPKAALQHAWDVQTLHKLNANLSATFSKRDLLLFSRRIIEQCDALDGVEDDLIFAIDACQTVFQPASLVCENGFERNCLSIEQVAALETMHAGPKNSANRPLYTDWVYDAGIRSANWRAWKVESTRNVWSGQPAGLVLGAAKLAHLYTTPFSNVESDVKALEKYLLAFDFDKDAPKIFASNDTFKSSAMRVMTPPDAVKPKLARFKYHGGKMMIFHGNSDPVFSVNDTVRWYDFLDFGLAGKAEEFVRFYRIPGMPHGQGGPSTDQFDMLTPLVNWVEREQVPREIIAATRSSNPEITDRMLGITRPLCPYPAYAQYRGGNSKMAQSFVCQTKD